MRFTQRLISISHVPATDLVITKQVHSNAAIVPTLIPATTVFTHETDLIKLFTEIAFIPGPTRHQRPQMLMPLGDQQSPKSCRAGHPLEQARSQQRQTCCLGDKHKTKGRRLTPFNANSTLGKRPECRSTQAMLYHSPKLHRYRRKHAERSVPLCYVLAGCVALLAFKVCP